MSMQPNRARYVALVFGFRGKSFTPSRTFDFNSNHICQVLVKLVSTET